MPDRVRQVKAEALEKQTPGRPKCFSSPSGGRTPQGGGLGGALKSIEGVNTVLRVLVREQTETALEPARQALDGSGILYTVHTGTGDKAEQYERCEASGREVIRQTG